MRKPHARLVATAAVVVTGLAVLGGGVAQASQLRAEPSPANGQPATTHSPADDFAGVYFGVGPVADALPDRGWPQDRTAREALAQAVTTRVEADAPGFLEHFATELRSGDHYRVATAVRSGAEAIAQIDAAPADGPVVVDVVLHLWPGPVVLPAPPILAYAYDQPQGDKALLFDQLVHQIVIELAHG